MGSSGTVLMPGGVRDLLPGEARRRRELERGLLELFASWGYQEIVTPTFEFYDCLAPALGKVMDEQLYRFIDDRGRLLLLKPDMTTPIARLVAGRLREQELPQRYCYVTNIFRRENGACRQREFDQAGVELIGAAGPEADAEVISLAGEALLASGIEDFRLTLGHARVLSGLLSGAGLSPREQEQALIALNAKDLVGWERLIKATGSSGEKIELLAGLPYLHGGIALLDQIAPLIADEETLQGVGSLRRVWEQLAAYGLQERVILDLTLLRGLDYYTGIVFEGYTGSVGYPLCGGGRYDQLLSTFGFPCPATGFALGMERIMSALESKGLPAAPVADYFITGGDRAKVVREAGKLRRDGCRVETEVMGRSREASIAYASRKGIPHILVVD